MADPAPRETVEVMNYLNTFIRIAPDCPEDAGIEPPVRGGKKPVHLIHLELLRDAPYQLTHEDLLVKGESLREPPSGETKSEIRARLREKSLPCLRTSALGKRYGWGIHFDAKGKIAVYPAGSAEYRKLAEDPGIEQTVAMRSRRARGC